MRGIGGEIKQKAEDFFVEEIPKRGKSKNDEHVIFWVEKINLDTQEVVRMLSRKLHVSKKRFGYAGTKDKFAIARQRFSLWDPEHSLEQKLKKLSLKNVKLYGFERGERLNLGDLEGNRFVIRIRDIALEENEIKARLEKIFAKLKKGIPNYFGEQRFGGIRAVTHLVGLEMLKGNFEEAVKIYVAAPFQGESEEVRKIREFLWKNWGDRKAYLKALYAFPKKFRYERAMLDYLYKHPRDFVGALRRFPKRIRKLFINAVQAWIFNSVLKELAEELGMEKLKGKKIPLVGYDTMLNEKSEIHKKVKEVMQSLGVEQKNFLLPSMPEMRTSGGEREAVLEVRDIKLIKIEEDNLNKGKKAAVIEFTLPPGSYATIVLEKIVKGDMHFNEKN